LDSTYQQGLRRPHCTVPITDNQLSKKFVSLSREENSLVSFPKTISSLQTVIMAGFIFYHPKLGEKRNKLLEEAFKGLDLNDDGKISVDEILTVFEENGVPCSREEVLTIFQSADKDGSGMLSIKEFKKSNKAVNMAKEVDKNQAGSHTGSQSPSQKRKVSSCPGEKSSSSRLRWHSNCTTGTRTATSLRQK